MSAPSTSSLVRCSTCGKAIRFVRTERGKYMPVEPEPETFIDVAGVMRKGYRPHWGDCQPVLFGQAGPAFDLGQAAEAIYLLYPRKVARDAAIKAIGRAITKVAADGCIPVEKAASWLEDRTRLFAESAAGRAVYETGDYRPHPRTWFSQGRYKDHVNEWGNWADRARDGQHQEPERDIPEEAY